jgi:hypothetical protein
MAAARVEDEGWVFEEGALGALEGLGGDEARGAVRAAVPIDGAASVAV